MSARLLTFEPLFQSCLSWSVVRQSTASALFVTTAMPSLAIWTWPYLTPAFLQTGTSSSSLMGREASEMSVSPAQNFSKPPPVPEVPTVTLTSGFSALNSSATPSVRGPTVLEPSTRIWPETESLLPPWSSPPPHAATPMATAPDAARTSHHLLDIQSLLF